MAKEHPVSALPEDTLVYLLGSRYCETEELMDDAWRMFGQVKPGWRRVQAICDFAHLAITIGRISSREVAMPPMSPSAPPSAGTLWSCSESGPTR
jgi:hypothetical protein